MSEMWGLCTRLWLKVPPASRDEVDLAVALTSFRGPEHLSAICDNAFTSRNPEDLGISNHGFAGSL